MLKHTLAILTTILLIAAADTEEEAVKKDTQALQGIWSFSSLIVDGDDKVADGTLKDVSLEFLESNLVFKAGENKLPLQFRIYPSTTPKGIDFTFKKPSENAKEGETLEGVYELDGDDLKFCVMQPGGTFKQRPVEFSGKEGKILVVLQRIKQ